MTTKKEHTEKSKFLMNKDSDQEIYAVTPVLSKNSLKTVLLKLAETKPIIKLTEVVIEEEKAPVKNKRGRGRPKKNEK
jgi:hypothetical protein